MDVNSIFDGFARMSEQVHRQDRIRNLTISIREIGRTCGDCDKWMKSSLCPQEKSSMTGYSKGPSCGALKCGSFVESSLSAKRRDKLNSELQAELAGAKA